LSLINPGDSVKTYDSIVKVIGHTVANPGPFGLEANLAGDAFGAFNTSGPPNVTQYPGALRGMDNAHEGVYIDDIIVGFAEHGEIITGASANATFVPNQELLMPTCRWARFRTARSMSVPTSWKCGAANSLV
jgi:hypothetical protein